MSSIIAFCGSDQGETGQTLSSIAVATMMAIDHKIKILHISTGFRDKTALRCFWEENKNRPIMFGRNSGSGIDNGIEGLVKLLQSNRTSNNIVADYTKVVFKDRLDFLLPPSTNKIEEYNQLAQYYPAIARAAVKNYDLVFIDIDKKMTPELQRKILEVSNVVVLTMKQSGDMIPNITEVRKNDEIFSKDNVVLMIGKYDRFSKFNVANVTRELKEKRKVCAISYNTLFFDASTEGKVADFFLNNRTISDKTDRNFSFMDETKRTCDEINYKIQELKMRL